jgi:nucleoside-diphosphate-sugar epimerase
MADIKTISILGCGWYGLAVAEELIKIGYKVKGTTTRVEKLEELQTLGIEASIACFEADQESYDSEFFDCDLLIISIPPKRSSGAASIYAEKIARINNVAVQKKVPRVLFISSTGVYGDYNTEVDESVLPNPQSDSGKAILEAENLTRESSYSATILRFGGLFGRDPARFFAGKKNIPNGRAPVNLIHLQDCIGLTRAIIEKDAFGFIFNACSINHPAKMDFYTRAAIKSNVEVPGFVDELREWKIVNSMQVKQILNYTCADL